MNNLYAIILFTALSIGTAVNANAQDYGPMAGENAHWVVKHVDGVFTWNVLDMWEYNCLGDTVVENTDYKKVYRRSLLPSSGEPPFTPVNYYSLFGFLRDDTAAKKVYARILPNDYSSFDCGYNEDFLLYDFSVLVNDMVDFCLIPSFYQSTLNSITPAVVSGVNTNSFMLSTGLEYYEGIGSEFGLFEDLFIPVKSTSELERNQLAYYCPSGDCGYTLPEVTLLTVGEVFDFSVGDEFQYSGYASFQTPNADRITITGKNYSPDNTTVTYERFHSTYYTDIVWNNGEPYTEYLFSSFTDTVSYTNLDQPLSTYDSNLLLPGLAIYLSDDLCDSLINKWYFNDTPGGFSGEEYSRSYGKGLGLTRDYHYSGNGQQLMLENKLFYYKKAGITCGSPDIVSTEGHRVETTIRIFPNPAQNEISLSSDFQFNGTASYQLYTASGTFAKSGTFMPNAPKISTAALPSGMYLIKIVTPSNVLTGKFMISR